MHIGMWKNLNGIELEVEYVSLTDNVRNMLGNWYYNKFCFLMEPNFDNAKSRERKF